MWQSTESQRVRHNRAAEQQRHHYASPGESTSNLGPGFNPWVRKIPWRRAWQPSPVFLPGESSWPEENWEWEELSSCLLSFQASGSFLMSQLLASGGQSIRASNQPILKEINPEYSLKVVMLKLKLHEGCWVPNMTLTTEMPF